MEARASDYSVDKNLLKIAAIREVAGLTSEGVFGPLGSPHLPRSTGSTVDS
jgi:hypothetical protein